MDLVQRALVWEAREPDLFVNFYFGFPWSDVPDAGMCFQVIANGDAALAKRVTDDMARAAWRRRAELVQAGHHPSHRRWGADGGAAMANGEVPVVLADHSDRSGAATWLLREILAQDLPGWWW